MKAEQVFEYGPPDVIRDSDIPLPAPGVAEVRIRAKAAGVGPWDALVREGRSGVPQSLPLILGADVAGVVDVIGPGVADFKIGDEVYGLTNQHFTGGYAEFSIASASSIALTPSSLTFIEAASAPVIAVTAWQMLFEYAHAALGQRVLVQGGAGNVGAYAVQLARNAGLDVTATASSRDAEYVRSLGARRVVDFQNERFEDVVAPVDIVVDTVGGETQGRSFEVIKPGGILVSVVSSPMPERRDNIRAVFFIVDVTTARLNKIGELFNSGKIKPQVGTVLQLSDARLAHRMLAGAPHARGKIVLNVGT